MKSIKVFSTDGSRFGLSWEQAKEWAQYAAIPAFSLLLTESATWVQGHDFGPWGPLVAVGLTVTVKLVQKYLTNEPEVSDQTAIGRRAR